MVFINRPVKNILVYYAFYSLFCTFFLNCLFGVYHTLLHFGYNTVYFTGLRKRSIRQPPIYGIFSPIQDHYHRCPLGLDYNRPHTGMLRPKGHLFNHRYMKGVPFWSRKYVEGIGILSFWYIKGVGKREF